MEYPEVGRIEVEEKAVLPEKSEIPQTGEPVLGVILNISVPAMVCRSCMNWSSRPERRIPSVPMFSYGNRNWSTGNPLSTRYRCEGMFVMPCHGSYYNTEILRLVIDGYPTVLIDKKLMEFHWIRYGRTMCRACRGWFGILRKPGRKK